MTRPLRNYIVQIIPQVLLDDTPSGSSSSDDDESVHSSHRSPPTVVPQIPVPQDLHPLHHLLDLRLGTHLYPMILYN